MTEKRRDAVWFEFQFSGDATAKSYALSASNGGFTHWIKPDEVVAVLSALPPASLGSTTRALAERITELQAIVDKRDGCEWDALTELFHPDMNVTDIVNAVKTLLGVQALAKAPGNSNSVFRTAVELCDGALWVKRPTQLEKDQDGATERPYHPNRSVDIAHMDALERGARRGATAEALWQMLDDIDTLSDAIKPSDLGSYRAFYERTLDIAKLRHDHLKSDGYKLIWPMHTSNAGDSVPREAMYGDLAETIENLAQGYAFEPKFKEHEEHAKVLRELFNRAHEATQAPVPMLLHCPMCHTRHIDEGEFATKKHHTHACQGYVVDEGKRRRCGHVWRPAIVATVGVEALPGFVNETVDGESLVGKHARVIENGLEFTIERYEPDEGKYTLVNAYTARLKLMRHEFTVVAG